jgi:hypothetical protein
MEEYLVYEEKAIAACKMHRDKEAEDRGGWASDKLSRPKQVWIPGPDHYWCENYRANNVLFIHE